MGINALRPQFLKILPKRPQFLLATTPSTSNERVASSSVHRALELPASSSMTVVHSSIITVKPLSTVSKQLILISADYYRDEPNPEYES
ncbi:uncharacterized protein G2W53_032765 [Senna tora]|uniref:Uncharacterized protein n=1 Tax=Senna tora TaxID=362788 RepID=A0A834WC59_9FABA|nr:uncharacterized protein G2W53_032765 [Senna tora]